MNSYCPICGSESNPIQHKRIEDLNVRGEIIPVDIEYYECPNCQEEFEIPNPEYDPLEIAYREYRRRKGFVQPEAIRDFRKKLGLTQKEFSDLIGIGIATLNRYENGSLQSEAHDRIIKLLMKPDNLLEILQKNQDILDETKRKEVLSTLKSEMKNSSNSWFETDQKMLGNYEPSIYSGNNSLNIEKLFQSIGYFCFHKRVYKTKLMKLLFFADFVHFRDYHISITGCKYAHLPYGPVPNEFETWLAILVEKEQFIQIEEEWHQNYPGEVFTCTSAPDLSIFVPSELKVLATIKEKFDNFTAKTISDLSHKEKAYRETRNGELISYSYAKDLATI